MSSRPELFHQKLASRTVDMAYTLPFFASSAAR